MAGKSAILSVRIVADAAKAAAGFSDAERQVGSFQDAVEKKTGLTAAQIDKVAVASTAAAAAYGAFAFDTMKSASDMEQAHGAVTSVFKDQAQTVMDAASTAAKRVGVSASEYANSAAVMGSQLRNMGISQDEVAGQTDKLISLSADLASMYGGTTADAIGAVSSLLRGERDPIERYAVSIKQADINARLAAQGLDGLEGEARKQAETQATLDLLFSQSADALGNFARESDTAAGSAQIAAAQWEDAKAKLGEQFLPIAAAAAEALGGIAETIGEHPRLFLAAGIAVGTFAAAMGAISGAIKIVNLFTEAQKHLNLTMLANPIVAVVAAVAALVGGLIYAYKHSEAFREAVNNLGTQARETIAGIVQWWNDMVASVQAGAQAVRDWIDRKIIEGFDWITRKITDVKEWWNNLVTTIQTGAQAARDWIDGKIIAGFEYVINKVAAARDWINGLKQTIINMAKTGAEWIDGKIIDAFRRAIEWVEGLISWCRDAWDWVTSIGRQHNRNQNTVYAAAQPEITGRMAADAVMRFFTPDILTTVGHAPDVTAARATATGGFAAPLTTATAAPVPNVFHITINGVLNASDAAREIRRLLDRDSFRRAL